MSGLHFHALRVASVRPDGDDAMLVSFDLPAELHDTFRFLPGQYVTLRQGEMRRTYSICAGPGEVLRVGVRRVPGGAFSGWLHGALKPGDVIDVMEPQGRFGAGLVQSARHVLAVAGGSGITPILSLIKALLAGNTGARCTLLYGNRSVGSTMFKEELEDLKNRYLTRFALHVVFSREVVDSPLHSGRLDSTKLGGFLKLTGPVDQAFVCGPHAMNDELEAALLQAGLLPHQIQIERFGAPPQDQAASAEATPLPGDAVAAHIGIVRDGLTREIHFHVGDGNILQAAVRAGMDLPYSCRSGVCATCRAKVLQGKVGMERNFALEEDDQAAGFVLTCQARPLTDRVVVSFDHR